MALNGWVVLARVEKPSGWRFWLRVKLPAAAGEAAAARLIQPTWRHPRSGGIGRAPPPAEWAWPCALLLGTGAIAVELLVVLVATPTLMRAVGLGEIADLCQEALGRLIPGGAPVGWAASTVAERIEALQADTHTRARTGLSRRLLVYVAATLLLLGVPVLVGGILGRADVLHHLAGICPSHHHA